MLRDRVISTCILVPILISILFLFSVTQFSCLLFAVCAISAWEWGKLMHFSENIYYLWIFVICSILCITLIMILIHNYLYFNCFFILLSCFSFVIIWWVFMLLLVLFYPYSSCVWNSSNVLRFCFGLLIIFPFFFGVLTLYKFGYSNNDVNGKWWLLYVLVLVWINDVSAYIIGQMFGTHKLLKYVSPKKTWEGFIGGILVSTIIAWIISKYMIDVRNFYIIFVCFVCAILFSVIGDLTESMFKRESGVKDTGNLIPGHGGILDRMDSLFSAIPVFTVLLFLLMYIDII
ncbi:phosphatidate cytidylyltransferase [Candidatus Blochmanniella floridana]|uniref:Phosphatidate cytidylyltransferase n=1 Tax=Blochmanniella floridana TaxID=203907 RepID=Q7VRE0_BLOFL|nr:phosphatidate cytidylyltransferase [Candidatus Blochmannia floridanus]